MAILYFINRKLPPKLFKGGNYSREETIRGNTVGICFKLTKATLLVNLSVDFNIVA